MISGNIPFTRRKFASSPTRGGTQYPKRGATEEPIFKPDAQHDAPGAADTPIPPAPVCWLSTQLVNEDALEDALADADVPTHLRALKGA